MKSFWLVIVSCALTVSLAGCAASTSTSASASLTCSRASAACPSSVQLATVSKPAASVANLPYKNVLYVADILDSRVDLYPLNTPNPAPIGEIVLGVDTPTGMALDLQKDLLVADNENRSIAGLSKQFTSLMPEYPKGGTLPIGDYTVGLRHPTDVAVGTDGTVYVASFGDGYVTEYPPGSLTPSLHFKPPSGDALTVALDSQNNLYVACTLTNAVFRFPPGSTQGTNLGLVFKGEPHGMAFDSSGNLLVADSAAPNSNSTIDVFPPGSHTPSQTITGTFQPFMIAFDVGKSHLYVADFGSGNHDGGVFEFAYPSGSLVTEYTQGGASGAYGVAVNPPAAP